MHSGYFVGVAVFAAVVLAFVFSLNDSEAFLGILGLLVIVPVVMLPLVALARVTTGGGTLSDHLYRPEGRALGLALLAIALAAAVPWIVALSDSAERWLTWIGVLLVLGVIGFAARQVNPGWAILTSIALVGACAVAALLSRGLAESVGWQDLYWRPTNDDPMDGSSVDIAWGIIGTVVFTPIAGIVLGIASQVNKRERVAS